MKKYLLHGALLTCLASFGLTSINGNAQTMVARWSNQLYTGNKRGLGYNAATDNLLLVIGGAPGSIKRINSTTGAAVSGDLTYPTGGSGTYHVSGLAIGSDNVIYGCNYTAAGVQTIYKWDNEAATPTVLWTGSYNAGGITGESGTVGTTLSVYGTGTSAVFILGSAGTGGLVVYHNGTAWTARGVTYAASAYTSGAVFVDKDVAGSGIYRAINKTGAASGNVWSFNPLSGSGTITPTATAMTGTIGAFSSNGPHTLTFDPNTGLLGVLTRVSSTSPFPGTNMLGNTGLKFGTGTLNGPAELQRVNFTGGTIGDGGAAGGAAWGKGAFFTSAANTGPANMWAWDVTAFKVSAPASVSGTAGDTSLIVATVFGGSQLTYSWKKGASTITDGAKYTGTTTSTLTINNLVVGDSATYTVTANGVSASTANAAVSVIVNAGASGPKTWTGLGADDNWSTGGNWGGTAPNLAGDTVFFDGSTRTTPVMDGSYDVSGLTFNAGASPFVLTASSGTLTLSGGVTNSSPNAQILGLPLSLSGARNFNAATATIESTNAISGAGSITKLGSQTLYLRGSSANTFSGLTMSAGNVVLGKSSGNAVAGAITVTAGTLSLENPNQISDSSVIDLQTSGQVMSLANSVTETIGGFSLGSLTAASVSGNVQLGTGAQLTVAPTLAVGYSAVSITAADPTGTKFTIGSTANGEIRWTPNNMVNTFEKLVVNSGGRLRLGHGGNLTWNGQDTMLGAVPASFMQDQITINNGQLGFNGGLLSSKFLVNANRGMTITGLATNENLVNAVFPGKITGTGTYVHTGLGVEMELQGINDFSGGLNLLTGSLTVSDYRSVGTGPIAFKSSSAVLGVSSLGVVITNKLDLSAVITNTFGNTTNFTMSGDVDLGNAGSSPILNVTNAGTTITFSGNTTNILGLVKGGVGKVLLSGNGLYSGQTIISNGTLGLNLAASLGTNALTLSGAAAALNGEQTLTLNQSGRNITNLVAGGALSASASAILTIADPLFGSVALTINGPGTVNLDNATAYTGATTISSGATLGGNGLPNAAITATGTLNVTGNQRIASLAGAGTVQLTGGLTIGGTASTSFSGSLTGIGSLIKTNTGVLTLTGNNDFSGGTTITDSRINFNNTSGGSAGTGTITINGLSEITGTLVGAILTNDIYLSLNSTGRIYGTSANTFNIAGNISGPGGLLRDNTGAASTILSGSNSFLGGMLISARVLTLSSSNALGTGTFTIGDPSVAPATAINLSSGIDLIGASSITNATLINQNFTISGTNGFELNGPVTLAAGTRTITFSGTNTAKISGNIDGPGALTKAGTGILQLTGNNTYGGVTTISAGTLAVNNTSGSGTGAGAVTVAATGTLGGTGTISGTVAISGTISPGTSPGTITTGAETWNGGGAYFWEIDNLTNDLINADSLVVSSTSVSQFTIGANALVGLTGWNANTATNWVLVHTTGGITGFTNVSQFNITNNFAAMGNTLAGSFTITTANGGNDLVLSYIPPSAVADTITREGGVGTKVLVSVLLANDVTGGTKTMTGVSATSASGNDVQMVGAYVYYSINVADPATDTFTYTLSDGTYTATGTVTVNKVTGNAQSQNVTASGTQGNMTISFAGIPGFSYNIQYTTDLAANPIVWTTVATVTADAKGQGSYQDNADHGAQAFYRTSTP